MQCRTIEHCKTQLKPSSSEERRPPTLGISRTVRGAPMHVHTPPCPTTRINFTLSVPCLRPYMCVLEKKKSILPGPSYVKKYDGGATLSRKKNSGHQGFHQQSLLRPEFLGSEAMAFSLDRTRITLPSTSGSHSPKAMEATAPGDQDARHNSNIRGDKRRSRQPPDWSTVWTTVPVRS